MKKVSGKGILEVQFHLIMCKQREFQLPPIQNSSRLVEPSFQKQPADSRDYALENAITKKHKAIV